MQGVKSFETLCFQFFGAFYDIETEIDHAVCLLKYGNCKGLLLRMVIPVDFFEEFPLTLTLSPNGYTWAEGTKFVDWLPRVAREYPLHPWLHAVAPIGAKCVCGNEAGL